LGQPLAVLLVDYAGGGRPQWLLVQELMGGLPDGLVFQARAAGHVGQGDVAGGHQQSGIDGFGPPPDASRSSSEKPIQLSTSTKISISSTAGMRVQICSFSIEYARLRFHLTPGLVRERSATDFNEVW
jgi:hypothetical protein